MNEAIFLAVLKNFVETTLNKPFADIAALLVSETNELKSDASDILKNLDTNRVNEIKASVNPEQSEIFKERIKNAKIEASRKFESEKNAFQTQINDLKALQTIEQSKLTERENSLKSQFESEKAALEKRHNDYLANVTQKEKVLKIRTMLENDLPIAKYKDVPQSAKSLILNVAMSEIGDIVEKDGKFSHFVDRNNVRLENPHGFAITAEQLGHNALSKMYLPLVQPPSGGAGNTNAYNAQINYDTNYYKGDD